MQGLHDRAGTASLVVIAKGQWEDNGQPMCFHTGLGADFLEQVCKMSLIEFMWRFLLAINEAVQCGHKLQNNHRSIMRFQPRFEVVCKRSRS